MNELEEDLKITAFSSLASLASISLKVVDILSQGSTCPGETPNNPLVGGG
jgi:hypothetical protein